MSEWVQPLTVTVACFFSIPGVSGHRGQGSGCKGGVYPAGGSLEAVPRAGHLPSLSVVAA